MEKKCKNCKSVYSIDTILDSTDNIFIIKAGELINCPSCYDENNGIDGIDYEATKITDKPFITDDFNPADLIGG